VAKIAKNLHKLEIKNANGVVEKKYRNDQEQWKRREPVTVNNI